MSELEKIVSQMLENEDSNVVAKRLTDSLNSAIKAKQEKKKENFLETIKAEAGSVFRKKHLEELTFADVAVLATYVASKEFDDWKPADLRGYQKGMAQSLETGAKFMHNDLTIPDLIEEFFN